MSFPVLDTDSGPDFYDVNGNKIVSAADALAVINELAVQSSGGGIDAEQIDQAPITDSDNDYRAISSEAPAMVGVSSDQQADKVYHSSAIESVVTDDLVDLIAADQESKGDGGQVQDAVDAAMADLR